MIQVYNDFDLECTECHKPKKPTVGFKGSTFILCVDCLLRAFLTAIRETDKRLSSWLITLLTGLIALEIKTEGIEVPPQCTDSDNPQSASC